MKKEEEEGRRRVREKDRDRETKRVSEYLVWPYTLLCPLPLTHPALRDSLVTNRTTMRVRQARGNGVARWFGGCSAPRYTAVTRVPANPRINEPECEFLPDFHLIIFDGPLCCPFNLNLITYPRKPRAQFQFWLSVPAIPITTNDLIKLSFLLHIISLRRLFYMRINMCVCVFMCRQLVIMCNARGKPISIRYRDS